MANYTYTPGNQKNLNEGGNGHESYFSTSTYSQYQFAKIENKSTTKSFYISSISLHIGVGGDGVEYTAGTPLTGNGGTVRLKVYLSSDWESLKSKGVTNQKSSSQSVGRTNKGSSGYYPQYSDMSESTTFSFTSPVEVPVGKTYYFFWDIDTTPQPGEKIADVFCWDYNYSDSSDSKVVVSISDDPPTTSIANENTKITFDLSEDRTVLYNNSSTVSVSNVKVTLNGTNITDSVSLMYSFDGGSTYKTSSSIVDTITKATTIYHIKVKAKGIESKGYSGTKTSGEKEVKIKCKLNPPKSMTLNVKTTVLYKDTVAAAYTVIDETNNPKNCTTNYLLDVNTGSKSTITGANTNNPRVTVLDSTTVGGRVWYTNGDYEPSKQTHDNEQTVKFISCKLHPPTIDSFTSGVSTSPIMYGTAHTLQCKASTNSTSPSGVITKTFGYPTASLPGTSPQTAYTAQAQSTKSGYTSSDIVTKQLSITYKLNPPVWNISWQNEKKYYPNYSFTCYSEFVYTLSSGTEKNPADLSPEYQRLWYDDNGKPKKTPSGEEDWKELELEEWRDYTKSLYVQGKSGLVSVKACYTKTGYTSSEYTRQLVHVCYSPRCTQKDSPLSPTFQVQNGSSSQNIIEDTSYNKNHDFKVSWSAFPVSLGIGRFNHYQIDLLKMNNSVIEETFTLKEDENDPSKSKEVVLDLSQKVSGTYRLKLTCICKTNSGDKVYDDDTGVVLTGDFKILSPPSFTVLYPAVGSDAIWYTMNPQARVIFQNNSPDGITNLSVSVNESSYPYQTNSLYYLSKQDLKPQLSGITGTQKIDFTSPKGSVSAGRQKFSITMTNSVGSFTKEFTLNLLSFSYQIKSSGKAAYVVHLTDYLDHVLSNYTKYYQDGSSAKSLLTDQGQVQYGIIKQKPFIDTLNALKTLYENVSEDSVPPSSLFRDLSKIDLTASPREILLESDSMSENDPPSFTIQDESNYVPIGNYFNYIIYILKNML